MHSFRTRAVIGIAWILFWLLMVSVAVQDYLRDDGEHLWQPVLWESSSMVAATILLALQPLMRQTLAGLLDKLGSAFVRCHRRAAVQLAWISSVVALDKGDCELVLRGGARVACSRQYKASVIERL